MNFPFFEELHGDKKIRTFSKSVDSEELTWHRDREDRTIRVLQSTGWYFQLDDELPVQLSTGDVLRIPREKWHRIARVGSNDLVVEIEETTLKVPYS